jgi:hypothetical protein
VRGKPVEGTVRLFQYRMADPVTSKPLAADVTSRSLWDQHLERQGFYPVFTMNTLNYDSISDLLVPRAAGYSAGLLNRFFRASIGAQVDPARGIRIYNSTPDEAAVGFFFLLHESPDGTRQQLAAFTLGIDSGMDSGYLAVAKLPPNPPPGTRCWLVFKGQLGEEPDVVAASSVECPVESPPPVHASTWAVYRCLFFPPQGGPDVRYTFVTQGWRTNPDGDDPVSYFIEGPFVQCGLVGMATYPEGPPPHFLTEHPS